jgi:TolB protein
VKVKVALLSLVVSTAALAQAPLLQISGANFRPLPLAVAAPRTDAGAKAATKDFDEAMLFDLAASGIFQLIDRKAYIADAKEGFTASTIDFNRWATVGADALVKTQLRGAGDSLTGDLSLFTVGSGKEDFKVSFTGSTKNPRELAHKFADALYRFYTREPSPFTASLAFVRPNTGNKEVWLADWDGRNARPVSQGTISILPVVAPGGDAVAFTSYRRGKPEIFVQSPGGSAKPLVQTTQMATGLSYSPDGKKIAYAISTGDVTQLYVANADGSGAKAITDSPSINTSPSWSPDGKRIAFVSNRGGSPQIYVMAATGGAAQRLTFQGNYNQTPEWSPRGDVIVFTARDERNAFDLFLVNVETRQITRLTQDQANNEEPSFSPNGRLITFTSNRNGWSQIFVMNADGSNQLPLPMPKAHYLTPDWGK